MNTNTNQGREGRAMVMTALEESEAIYAARKAYHQARAAGRLGVVTRDAALEAEYDEYAETLTDAFYEDLDARCEAETERLWDAEDQAKFEASLDATIPEPVAPALPPAGWYSDPSGQARLRWFDGQVWTGYVAA